MEPALRQHLCISSPTPTFLSGILSEEAIRFCFHTWFFPALQHLKCSDLGYLGDYILDLLSVIICDV